MGEIMENIFIRSEMLYGENSTAILGDAKVAVFGIGGVGSYVCEALARCGIGNLTLIDNDTVSFSNINRQLVALHSTVGKYKTEIMAERIKDINPSCNVTPLNMFYTPESDFDISSFDYIVDAIDTVSSKIHLAVLCQEKNIPLISCMGAGNKLDPTAFKVTDIFKTSGCPLARVMRKELKARGVKKLKVVYSTEEPITPVPLEETEGRRQTPGSCAFVPSVAGLICAGEVIKDIVGI